MGAVLGVDGCRAGWVGVRLDGAHASVLVAADIATLADAADHVEVIAIDIPIFLPVSDRREAEIEARRRLPGRASTVFNSPARAALGQTDYADANAANRTALGLGLSRQSFGLFPAIIDVQSWLTTSPDPIVVEAHPELSFAAMHGAVLIERKTQPAGEALRRALLHDVGIHIDTIRRRGVSTDDVLDAAAVAWTARRVADAMAERIPADPRIDGPIWV